MNMMDSLHKLKSNGFYFIKTLRLNGLNSYNLFLPNQKVKYNGLIERIPKIKAEIKDQIGKQGHTKIRGLSVRRWT